MSCFHGDHSDFQKMTTINYAGAFVPKGEDDPIDEFMKILSKQGIKFSLKTKVDSIKKTNKGVTISTINSKFTTNLRSNARNSQSQTISLSQTPSQDTSSLQWRG